MFNRYKKVKTLRDVVERAELQSFCATSNLYKKADGNYIGIAEVNQLLDCRLYKELAALSRGGRLYRK